MKLIFATQNRHKLYEVQSIIGNQHQLISLADLNYFDELPETHFTLEENAEEKSEFIHARFNADCFAEDTGLEIEALNNEPGVFSARYAGEQKSALDNISLVLSKMAGVTNRKAKFRTVICLITGRGKYFFEGAVEGNILFENAGTSGFGYDPIFAPLGYEKSFAQLSFEEKNKVSHRSMAFIKMKNFLHGYVQ